MRLTTNPYWRRNQNYGTKSTRQFPHSLGMTKYRPGTIRMHLQSTTLPGLATFLLLHKQTPQGNAV
jgi:hypothetical protein